MLTNVKIFILDKKLFFTCDEIKFVVPVDRVPCFIYSLRSLFPDISPKLITVRNTSNGLICNSSSEENTDVLDTLYEYLDTTWAVRNFISTTAANMGCKKSFVPVFVDGVLKRFKKYVGNIRVTVPVCQENAVILRNCILDYYRNSFVVSRFFYKFKITTKNYHAHLEDEALHIIIPLVIVKQVVYELEAFLTSASTFYTYTDTNGNIELYGKGLHYVLEPFTCSSIFEYLGNEKCYA